MIKKLKTEYNQKKQTIKQRLKDFENIKGNDLFYELCFCLLTPQSNAYKCDECINILKENNFLYKDVKNIKDILKTKTRFYKNKSNYLIEFKSKSDFILNELKKIKDNKEKREFLVKNVKGLGYKESSHFLRNIGCKNLAILDRHILKNLQKYKVINNVPKTLNKRQYLSIEDKFYNFSKKIKIPMDELDLLFWSMETGRVFK